MKTLVNLSAWLHAANSWCLSAVLCRHTLKILMFCCCIYLFNYTYAQDINLQNPSLEGTPQEGRVPSSWHKTEKSADTHPGGCCSVDLPASDGKTYVGALANEFWVEGVEQRLTIPLKAGKSYTVSVDLAYPPLYYNIKPCYGSFAIYGSNIDSEDKEILWESDKFFHTAWKTYNITLTPSKTYDRITVAPYYDEACSKGYSGVLIDNFSPFIREVPQIEINAYNTCKGSNTGTAVVHVKNGEAPYSYTWNPGNYTGSRLNNLQSGAYEVIVTGANGASTKGQITIEEYEIAATAIIVEKSCYGANNASIKLNAVGGVAPYLFSIDNGYSFQESPVFANPPTGKHNIVIKDNFSCSVKLDNINIKEPSPLRIISAVTQPVSCSETHDGRITLSPTGGTPPYTYTIPGYTSQSDSIIRRLDAGRYHYLIKDSHDCTIEGDAEITKEWRDCAVFIPNAFSPNGDGINDLFRPRVHDDIRDYRMAVYGRWGQLVFETRDPGRAWDGTQKGTGLPAGSYLWVVTYTDSKQQPMKQQGNLFLIR